ncbi:hypothetical protein NHX12_004909 [Muraenolepis orangiensis]|uniref:Dehydrogenase/reductase SDR family member 12 n=1 Tax=Muraenolepis orangiensis TaxID=630683 RepID=A0A9Q0DXP1_9TELE|nr:hypothetical protein NHX12_004909 [Muraenolepis orangiensis]
MSLYRNLTWFLKGMKEYTRDGYDAASKSFIVEDLSVSHVGRSFMVTGANSGIGKETAAAIAKKGGTVHMVCRNKDKAEMARADIIRESGNTEVHIHILDLSETTQVWEFAETFQRQYPTLNVLINNAGCMINKREKNSIGLEKNFATNTLGVYILTQSLMPLLQKSRDPRVITVSSGGMLVQQLRAHNLQSKGGFYRGPKVYAQNKRQQVVLTEHWAKTQPVIHFSAMHPGWVDTPAVSSTMPQFRQMMGERLRSAAQGADTVVWLALSRGAPSTPSGSFFQDRKAVPTHLPMAWTNSSAKDVAKFLVKLETLAQEARPQPADPQPGSPTESSQALVIQHHI